MMYDMTCKVCGGSSCSNSHCDNQPEITPTRFSDPYAAAQQRASEAANDGSGE